LTYTVIGSCAVHDDSMSHAKFLPSKHKGKQKDTTPFLFSS